MSTYVDVGVTRIQEYLTRTSGADEGQLRRRRGASRMVSEATDPGLFRDLSMVRNEEAYHVEGVAHLQVVDDGDGDGDGRRLAEAALRVVRARLPMAYLQASWATADSYQEAHALLERARREQRVRPALETTGSTSASGVLESLPLLREDPFAARCDGCGLAPAARQKLCVDCLERDRAGGRPREEVTVQTPEARTIAAVSELVGRDLAPVQDLGTLARLVDVAGDKRNHLATVYADGNAMGQLFAGVGDRSTAKRLSEAIDGAIRSAGAEAIRAVHERVPERNAGTFPAVVTVLAADDALITVPAPYGWLFARTLVSTFTALIAASDVVTDLLEQAARVGRPLAAPSLTAGIAFSQVKSPIESAIRIADESMREAKRAFPGAAAIGWADLTHPSPSSVRPRPAAWLDNNIDLVDTVAALPGSARAGWEQLLLDVRSSSRPDGDGAHVSVSEADLEAYVSLEFDRLGHVGLRDAALAPSELEALLHLTRWWAPQHDGVTTTEGQRA